MLLYDFFKAFLSNWEKVFGEVMRGHIYLYGTLCTFPVSLSNSAAQTRAVFSFIVEGVKPCYTLHEALRQQ